MEFKPRPAPLYWQTEAGRQGDFLNPYISQVGQHADKLQQAGGPSRTALMAWC